MPYAIDISDLERLAGTSNRFAIECLLSPVTKHAMVVSTNRRTIDRGPAIVLECDDERALAIIGVLNHGAKTRGLSPVQAWSFAGDHRTPKNLRKI